MTEAAQGNLHFGLKQLKSEWALMLNSVNITKSIPVGISYTVEALKTPTDWILALKWDENDSSFSVKTWIKASRGSGFGETWQVGEQRSHPSVALVPLPGVDIHEGFPGLGGVAMGDTAVAEVAAATFPRCLALDPPGARMGVGKEEEENGAVSG